MTRHLSYRSGSILITFLLTHSNTYIQFDQFLWIALKCLLLRYTVYPKKYAHGYCFAVHCCGYTLTDFPISIRLTSLALWQSNDCPSASKATLMNMDKYFMRIHYERLHNHNKAKYNKTDVKRRQTLGHPRSINPNMINHVPQQLPIIF